MRFVAKTKALPYHISFWSSLLYLTCLPVMLSFYSWQSCSNADAEYHCMMHAKVRCLPCSISILRFIERSPASVAR